MPKEILLERIVGKVITKKSDQPVVKACRETGSLEKVLKNLLKRSVRYGMHLQYLCRYDLPGQFHKAGMMSKEQDLGFASKLP